MYYLNYSEQHSWLLVKDLSLKQYSNISYFSIKQEKHMFDHQ